MVKHINADHVYDISIPLFPTPCQEEVNNLINGASKLREEATAMLIYSENLSEEQGWAKRFNY